MFGVLRFSSGGEWCSECFGFRCDGPGGVDTGPDVTFLTEPVRVASQERGVSGNGWCSEWFGLWV